jgi:hypothetical protein
MVKTRRGVDRGGPEHREDRAWRRLTQGDPLATHVQCLLTSLLGYCEGVRTGLVDKPSSKDVSELFDVLETLLPLVLDEQFPHLISGLTLLGLPGRDRDVISSRRKEDMSTRVARLQMLQLPLRDRAGENQSFRGMRLCPSDRSLYMSSCVIMLN